MIRSLNDHEVGALGYYLSIAATDEPDARGVNHDYYIRLVSPRSDTDYPLHWELRFQKGPIKEAGFNGISEEALLVIVIDRLRSFQAGPLSTKEFAVALTHIETGLLWLQKRIRDRMARDVDGTTQK